MKKALFILGKRKLIWTVVMVVGVMFPLLAASYYIPAAGVAGDAAKMLTYTSEGEGFAFSYPQNWTLRTEKDYSGGEVLENVTFVSPDKKAHGSVQVIKISGSVPEYVLEFQKSMAQGYDSLHFRQEKTGSKQGYVLTYSRGRGEARQKAIEYFFQNGEKVYRFSFVYPETRQEQYSRLVGEMAESLAFEEMGDRSQETGDSSSGIDN